MCWLHYMMKGTYLDTVSTRNDLNTLSEFVPFAAATPANSIAMLSIGLVVVSAATGLLKGTESLQAGIAMLDATTTAAPQRRL